MKDVVVPLGEVVKMRAHARETYPEECCGFLVGNPGEDPEGSVRHVAAVERASNGFDGERRRRFLIEPKDLIEIERKMEREGRAVVGFYHSHPDHPARPSQFDQDHAWPWYSYLVLSVDHDEVGAIGAFELDPDDSVFREVRFRSEPDGSGSRPVTQG